MNVRRTDSTGSGRRTTPAREVRAARCIMAPVAQAATSPARASTPPDPPAPAAAADSMPKRWLDFMYVHRTFTFVLMVAFFLLFGVTSVNLFVLLKMNIDLFIQYGWIVIEDGALEQLVDLLGSAFLSIVFYLVFKICERVLVERLTEKKFGPGGAAPR